MQAISTKVKTKHISNFYTHIKLKSDLETGLPVKDFYDKSTQIVLYLHALQECLKRITLKM